MTEIGTAYVRIRPNLATFEAETATGVKGALSGIAKVVGLSIGADVAFQFAKGVVQGAAQIQKSTEVIRAAFGTAGDAVVEFGRKGALALGASAQVTDAASAKFGILFANLGIGQKTAAGLTLGYEKLALATASVKGADPTSVLDTIALAASGKSTRGLAQLGVVIDSTQQKLAALKDGFITTTKQALTPAQKALVTFQLATGNLPRILDLAKAHSHDLADEQARLNAAWADAKAAVGSALLPVFSRYTSELADWLTKMTNSGKLQRDVNAALRDAKDVIGGVKGALATAKPVLHDVVGLFGGFKRTVELLIGLKVVSSLSNWGAAFQRVAGTAGIGKAEGAALELRGTLKGLVSKPWVIAIALSFIPPNKKGQDALDKAGLGFLGKLPIIGGAEQQVARAGQLAGQAFTKGVSDAFGKQHATGAQPFKSPFLTETLTQINAGLTAQGKKPISEATYELSRRIAEGIGSPDTKATVKKAATDLGKSLTQNIADAVNQGASGISKAVSGATLAATEAAAKARIQAAVTSAKSNLDKIGQDLAKTLARFTAKAGGLGVGAGGPAFQKLKALISSGAPSFEIARASTELQSQLQNVGKTQTQTGKDAFANLTDSFNKRKITLREFNKRFATILADDHADYKKAGKLLGSAFADGYKAQVEGLLKQAALISHIPANLRGVGGGGGPAAVKIINPLETIRQENARIAASASKERARIAKAAEKTAAGVAALKTLPKLAPLPGYGNTPPGHAAKNAKSSAGAGVQP